MMLVFLFFKQKTSYELRISDWSSDVCSSDLTWTSLLVAALGIPFATVTTGARGIVEAYQDFKAVSLIRLCLGVATFGLPVISVWLLGPSLAWAAAAIVMARLVDRKSTRLNSSH